MTTNALPRPLLSRDIDTAVDEAAGAAWSNICQLLLEEITEKAFHTWFKPVQPLELKERVLTVQVPSKFYYDWIEGHYSTLIEAALTATLGEGVKLVYVTASRQDDSSSNPLRTAGSAVSAPSTNPRGNERGTATGLNPRYLFENFIEGPNNSFARAAALSVGQSPGGTSYNPLLIYGGAGLGKTHLLHAIGHQAIVQRPDTSVLYISSEKFTQDFVEAIKTGRAGAFSNRFRSVDVLLVDDVQFFGDKEQTRMEFFHTFNALQERGKQIVLTSDKPPRELNGLDERLVSRFISGLVVDIAPPDYETRTAIIQKLSEEEGVYLDSAVIDYLARSFKKNVREMQGALIRLLAHASIHACDITTELARSALKDLLGQQQRRVTVEIIQEVVAQYFQIAPDLMLQKLRTQPIARARMVAMALSSRLTGLSLKQVGNRFGKRDHTTVLHAQKKVSSWEKEDPDFASMLSLLVQRIEDRPDSSS